MAADVTLNRPDTVERRTEESGRKCGERLRIARRLEVPLRGRRVVRAKQIELGETDVRNSVGVIGNAGAGEIKRPKAAPLCEERRVGIDGAGDLQGVLDAKGRTEF